MARRRILSLASCASCAALTAWATAAASPLGDPTSGRAVFTGAATPHATSILLDPAALGLSVRNEVYFALTGVVDQRHIDLAPLADGDLSSPAARVRAIELSPGAMLALTYHFAGNLTLGFEARAAPTDAFPANRTPLRFHTLGDGERAWLASIGGSIRLTGDFLVGAGITHQNTFLRLRYARDTALERGRGAGGVASDCGGAPCGLANPMATELYDVDVQSPATLATSNLRVNVGILYQVARDVWLAVAYHTPPGLSVQTELTGHVDVTRAPRDVAAGGDEVVRGDAVVVVQLPASVDLELRARLTSDLELHVAGRWQDLSRLTAYDVRAYGRTLPQLGIPEWTQRPRGLNDSIAAWAGVEQIDRGLRFRPLLGARAGVESSSVSTPRTSPLTIGQDSVTLDLGAQVRLPGGIIAQLSYGLQYFPSVTVTESAFDPRDRIACVDSGYDYATSACKAVREGYAIAPAAGTYERIEHALRIGLRYELF